MAKVTVKFESKRLLGRIDKAWQQVNETDLPQAFRAEAEAEKFQWPRETIRSSGSVVNSPRSVVDTGTFRDSQETQRAGKNTYVHAWTAPYSALVINGATLRSGTMLPARDVTQVPLEQLPAKFARRFREAQ